MFKVLNFFQSADKRMTSSASDSCVIEVNPDTNDPQRAWSLIQKQVTKTPVTPLPLDTPIYPDKVSLTQSFSRKILKKIC